MELKLNMKVIGYGIAGLGLIGMFLSSKLGQGIIGEGAGKLLLPSLTITAAGIVVLLLAAKTSGGFSRDAKNKGKEVPIYKDKEVIGYRVVE